MQHSKMQFKRNKTSLPLMTPRSKQSKQTTQPSRKPQTTQLLTTYKMQRKMLLPRQMRRSRMPSRHRKTSQMLWLKPNLPNKLRNKPTLMLRNSAMKRTKPTVKHRQQKLLPTTSREIPAKPTKPSMKLDNPSRRLMSPQKRQKS